PGQDLAAVVVGHGIERRLLGNGLGQRDERSPAGQEGPGRTDDVDLTGATSPDLGASREAPPADHAALWARASALPRPHGMATTLADLGPELVTPAHAGRS